MSETLKDIGIGVGSAAAGAGASYIAYEAWRRSAERTVLDGKPASSTRVDAAGLAVDAETFQFKSGGDRTGVTDRLQGVKKWNAAAAGKVMVYEYADGRRVVADGHQRLGLAKRLMSEGHSPIKMDAIVLRQSDGWSPRDVRAFAAIKNMHESSGNALDMARVMRERPDLVTSSLPVSDAKIREAKALSKLSNDAFRSVASGSVEPGVAAAVAEGVPDSSRHVAMIKEMAEAKIKGHEHARLYVKQAMAAPSISETTTSLFGDETQVRSLTKERSTVLHRALTSLKSNKKLFAMLEREADTIEAAGNRLARDSNAAKADTSARLGTLVEKLATQRGNVSRLLDEAAQAVASGEKAPKAARSFLKSVQSAMEKGGIQALVGDGPLPLEANGGMQRMTDSGDRQAKFREMLAETRARYEYAENLLNNEMQKPHPKLAVTKNGMTTVLTKDPGGNGFRVTSILNGEPIGHRDYPNARPGSQDMRMLVQDMVSGGLDVPKKGSMQRMTGNGGRLKSSVGRFGVYHVGKNAYEIRDNVTGGVLGTAKQLGPAMSDARVLRGLEIEGDPHGVLKDKLAAVGGEPTPRPPPGDIEVGKTYRSKRNQKYTVMTKDAGKITVSMGDGVYVTYDEAQFRRMIGKPEQSSFLPAATTKEQIAAAAKAKGKPGVPQQEVGGLFGDGMKQMDLVDRAREIGRSAGAGPGSSMLAKAEAVRAHLAQAVKDAPAKAGAAHASALADRLQQVDSWVDTLKRGSALGSDRMATISEGLDEYSRLASEIVSEKPSGNRPGWSDEARAASAEVRAANAKSLREPSYRMLPNGDKMFSDAENARRLAEAMSLPKSDPTRGMKIEHAKILAGTAWRPDGTAYVPALNELMEKTLRDDQAKAFAQTKRGSRAGKKAADLARIKQQIKDDLGPRGDGKHRHVDGTPITKENMNTTMEQRAAAKPAGPLATSRAKGKKTEYAVRIGDKIVDTRTSDRAYTHAIVARHSFESDMKTGGSIHKVDQRNFDHYTEVAKRQPDKFTPAEYIEQAKATVAKYGNRDAYAKAKMEGRVAEITAKKAAGYYDKPVVVAWAGRPDLANKQVASYGKAGQWADVQAVQVGGNEGKPVGWSDEARAASAKARGVAAPGEAKRPRQAKLPSAAKLAHIGGDDTFKKFEQGLSRRTPEQLAQLKAQAEAGIKTARDMQMRGEKGMSKVAARENSTKASRSTYHRASNLQKDGVWKEAAYKRALAAIENAKGKPPKAAKTPTAKSLTSSAKAAGVRDPNAAFADVFGKTAKSAGKKGLAMLGPVAVVGAGALAFDSTRNQAMAAGKTSGQANLNAAGAAAIASGSVAAIGYGISKAVSLAARAAPVAGKVLSRALPVAAVGFAAYEVGRGAVRGYKEGGVGGAFKGAGEGALDFATMGAYSHFTGKEGEGQQGRLSVSQKKQFAQADSNYRAMQDAKAAQSNGSSGGWSDQARIAAYISRVSHAGGTPENLPYGGVPRAEATTEKPSKRR